MTFRTFLLGISALLVAGCAAFFSVTGLSKLFAGASLEVILMAGSLEFAKLVTAGFLHNYWTRINGLLKTYLTIATIILMLITSAGIYGFLTSAYKVTSDQLSIIDKQTETIQLKRDRYDEELTSYNAERAQLNQSINELSKGLSNNVVQYKDKDGNIITSTSSATRTTLEKQLNDFKKQRDNVTSKIDVLNDSITSLDLQVLDMTANNELAQEIGPLRYISDVSGRDMDTIVNWFALFIVLVFDPLAVTLIIAFSAAMKIDKGEKDKKKLQNSYKVYGEEPKPSMYEIEPEVSGESTIKENIVETNDEPKEELSQESIQEDIHRIDGMTRADYEAGGWRKNYDGKPYYLHPWFNWNKTNRWIHNQKAVDYWLKFRGGNIDSIEKLKSNYPENFDSKTY